MKNSKLSPTTRWILFLTALIVLTIFGAIMAPIIENKWNENIASLVMCLGFIACLAIMILLYYHLIIGHDPEKQKIKTGAR